MGHILLWIVRRRQAYFRTLYNRKKNPLDRTYLIHAQDAVKRIVHFFPHVPFRNGLRLPSPILSLLRVARSPAETVAAVCRWTGDSTPLALYSVECGFYRLSPSSIANAALLGKVIQYQVLKFFTGCIRPGNPT